MGFRPLAFFENGNQYGLWVAATAFAAIWLWQSEPQPRLRMHYAAVAVLALVIAMMSQSIGAILLLLAGLILFWAIGRRFTRWALPLIFFLMASGVAIYLSGALPLRAIAQNTVVGRQVVDMVRSTGRGSFTWRIARDQGALRLIDAHPVIGTPRWDWWRENGERPWGLAFLVVGQFGLIGLLLAFSCLLIPTLRNVSSKWLADSGQLDPGAPLAIIVLMSVADALINSFIFYPSILAAAALAVSANDRDKLLRSERQRTHPNSR
jgi:O-antigen ligase